jgi:hypothetical protein
MKSLMSIGIIVVLAAGLGIYLGSNPTSRDTLLNQNEASEVSEMNETTGSKSQPVVEKQSRSDVLAILKARDEREMAAADQAIVAD